VKVLGTGGSGFIGSHVVDALVDGGHEVVTLDRMASPWPNSGATVVAGDGATAGCWEAALEGVEAVCHQAARVGLGVDFGDVTAYVRDNDLATAAMLLALHRRRFAGRLVLASSMVVYGEGRYRCHRHGVVRPGPRLPEDLARKRFDPGCPRCGAPLRAEAVGEDAPADPRNVYAATKLHQEHLCFAYGREHGASVVALRYHNVYGPRMPRDTPYAGVASIFRSCIAQGQPPLVFEDGAQRRDFVHVADVARANLLALTRPLPADAIALNVATGAPHTVGDMAAALCPADGSQPPPQVTGQWRTGDVRHVFASPRLAAETIGFRASVGFIEGMAELRTAVLRPR